MQTQNKIIFFLLGVTALVLFFGYDKIVRSARPAVDQNQSTQDASSSPESRGISLVELATTTTSNASSTQATQAEVSRNMLYVGKKAPDNKVFIDIAVLEVDGFIVIYENTTEPTGELLGVSPYLTAGEYTNIPIMLMRKTEDGERFDAQVHKDNGDRTFNIADDVLFRDVKGNSVFTRITFEAIGPQSDSVVTP